MPVLATNLANCYQSLGRLADRFLASAYAAITEVAELPSIPQAPGTICQPAIGANRLEVVIFQTDWDTVSAALERAGYHPQEMIPGIMRYCQGAWLNVTLRKAQTNTQLELSVDEAYRIEERHDGNPYTITQAVLCYGLREIMAALTAYRSRYIDLDAVATAPEATTQGWTTITNTRYRAIVQLWHEGMSEKEIAARVDMEMSTINKLMPMLRKKYGVETVPYRLSQRRSG